MNFQTEPASLWLRPNWLRPLAMAVGLAINLVAAILISRARVEEPVPLPSIEVAILPPNVEPAQAPTEPTPVAPPPEQKAPPEPPPPPEAAPPQEVAPPPPPPPKAEPDREQELRQEQRLERQKEIAQKKLEERRKQEKIEKAQERREEAREKAEKAKAAEKRAAARSSGPSRAAYGAIVVSELRRLQGIGASRAGGATGRVHVTFTIGPSGRIVSHSAGSGDARLAAAAAAMMAAFHAPPPPGGHFTGATNFSFGSR